MNKQSPSNNLAYSGEHISVATHKGWEYVVRNTGSFVVAVVAVSSNDELLLVQQYRPPICRSILELPGGLVGDLGEENPLEAARRELLEETGYAASHWAELCRCPSSPGLTNETVIFFRAKGLSKEAEGGGIDGESIRVVHMPVDKLAEKSTTKGAELDLKVAAALSMLKHHAATKA